MNTHLLALVLFALSDGSDASTVLASKVWNHGAIDCSKSNDPAIEVLEVDPQSYVLRQNKCVNVEAPFIYVLFGKHTVFVQDTGANADPGLLPLYDTLQGLIARRNDRGLKVLVAHSHSHSDHTAGDPQFRGRPDVTLVEPTSAAVRAHFGLTSWPEGFAMIDLGGRVLEVVPAPGHQGEGIAVYDAQTGWLLTGDTVYPGRLSVSNWDEYRASIARLAAFSKTRQVTAVLGSHIEMSDTGTLFPPGSTYQPREASLVLTVEDLAQLDDALRSAGSEPKEVALKKFLVTPIGAFQRVLGAVLKWLGVR